MRKFSIHGTEEGNTTSIKLDEIAILADPDTLLKIGEFIIKTAHVMKGYEVDYSHLQDEVSDFDSKNTNNIKEFIYSNEEISNNFFNLIKFKKNDLEDIYTILNYIKESSKKEDLEIYGKELDRGIYEVRWIIEEKKLYQSIFENFEDNILSKNSIVNEEYKEEDFSQNQYLIETFSNKLWKDINKETIINFLEGLDFYYLSNEAYFFIIPACIRYGIEKFENNEDLEYLLFFLSDRDRVKYANDKIKKLVVSYLELLKKLKFLVFGREEEKCLEIWR